MNSLDSSLALAKFTFHLIVLQVRKENKVLFSFPKYYGKRGRSAKSEEGRLPDLAERKR